jgi:hypothetical protein
MLPLAPPLHHLPRRVALGITPAIPRNCEHRGRSPGASLQVDAAAETTCFVGSLVRRGRPRGGNPTPDHPPIRSENELGEGGFCSEYLRLPEDWRLPACRAR